MSNMAKKIKLQADYGCWPLWDVDNPSNLSLEKFKLSETLHARLGKWVEEYNQQLDWDNLGDPTPLSPGEGAARRVWYEIFLKEGALMWLELRKELADEYEVSYFISGHGLLTDPKELENFAFWTS